MILLCLFWTFAAIMVVLSIYVFAWDIISHYARRVWRFVWKRITEGANLSF